MEFLNSRKHMSSFVISPFETCLWNFHLYFLKINKNSHVCSTKFSSRIKKMSIIWKIWTFYPGLKFHLWLVKPSWNFNLLCWVEIFTCNCNVILQSSLLFSRDKISTRYIELKFQPGLKIFSSFNISRTKELLRWNKRDFSTFLTL